MGDESYFSAKYPKGESIEQYYNKIDNGITSGLEEVESMLVAQFKERNQNLQEVTRTAKTMVGLKESLGDNLLSYLEIFGTM
jgi:hypothetical protein